MKRKLLSVLLASAMLVSLTACGNNDNGAVTNNESAAPKTESTAPADNDADADTEESQTEEAPAEVSSERPTTPSGQLVIGTITDLEQDFYDPIYNNNATNYKVCGLLHGYNTVITTKEGEWQTDPVVVADLQTAENEDGTKTYTIKINDGLVWTDDSPVTAKDYVFALLLESSPEMMGVDNYAATNYTTVEGWADFNSGATKALKGVHLIDDMTFSVTIAAEELPYHYDLAYAYVTP